jgi:CRISPR-associated endoribonuclease Cas6
MSDLLSLRIALKLAPDQELDQRPIPKWWGEAAHKLAILAIASRDETLARELESSAGLKPFTVSNLRGRFPGGRIDPASLYKIRFTALDKRVASAIESARREGILRGGETVELDFIKFQVKLNEPNVPDEIETSTYQFLTNSLFSPQPPPRALTLEFVSPTMFRQGEKKPMPFPMPEMVFGSLLDHWNASSFVPTTLPEEARKYAKECLQLGRFDLQSRVLKMYGETFRGFVGRVRFQTTNYDRYWMSIMTMLAQYANYAGVGAKTTMGLGQCYLLPDRATPASA